MNQALQIGITPGKPNAVALGKGFAVPRSPGGRFVDSMAALLQPPTAATALATPVTPLPGQQVVQKDMVATVELPAPVDCKLSEGPQVACKPIEAIEVRAKAKLSEAVGIPSEGAEPIVRGATSKKVAHREHAQAADLPTAGQAAPADVPAAVSTGMPAVAQSDPPAMALATAPKRELPASVATAPAKSTATAGLPPAKATKGLDRRPEVTAMRVSVANAVDSLTSSNVKVEGLPSSPSTATVIGDPLEVRTGLVELPHAHLAGHHEIVASALDGERKTNEVGLTARSVDEVTPPSDLKTLVATPNVLEVGVASGTHGWLKVRAEFDRAGDVAASVVATSTATADGLHKELPAISAFLTSEHVGVSSLVVNAAERIAGAQDSTLSAGVDTGQASHGGPGRQARESPGPSSGRVRESGGDVGLLREPGPIALVRPPAPSLSGSGGWINVRV